MSQTKTSTADYCAVSLYCFLGVGCFAGVFAHTAELPEPRQNIWGYVMGWWVGFGLQRWTEPCGCVMMLPAKRRDGNGGKKENVCGLIGLLKMSVFTTARLCLLLRAGRGPGGSSVSYPCCWGLGLEKAGLACPKRETQQLSGVHYHRPMLKHIPWPCLMSWHEHNLRQM